MYSSTLVLVVGKWSALQSGHFTISPRGKKVLGILWITGSVGHILYFSMAEKRTSLSMSVPIQNATYLYKYLIVNNN
jgi:hypothetical protein